MKKTNSDGDLVSFDKATVVLNSGEAFRDCYVAKAEDVQAELEGINRMLYDMMEKPAIAVLSEADKMIRLFSMSSVERVDLLDQ